MNQKTTDELLYDIMSELEERSSDSPSSMSRKVMILSTPRSGSTMFCDVLNRTEKLGECREWFNLRYLQAFARLKRVTNVDFNRYLEFIISRTLRGTDTFVVNMHIDQLQSLLKNKIDPFLLGFDEVFYVYRRDKVRQSVSLARAWQTDQWTSNTKPKREQQSPPSNGEIARALHMLIAGDEYYRENLSSKVKMEFAYEVFRDLADQEGFPRLFKALGIGEKIETSTELSQQSDSGSSEVVQGFLEYIEGR